MLQEAFVSIYRDLHQFDSNKGKFVHWAKRVVINTCLQKLRKKNVLDKFDEIEDKIHNLTVESTAMSSLSLEELTSLIHKLPEGRKMVFNLYVIDGFNHNEIAEMLGVSPSTSKTQLMRARKFLKTDIERINKVRKESYA